MGKHSEFNLPSIVQKYLAHFELVNSRRSCILFYKFPQLIVLSRVFSAFVLDNQFDNIYQNQPFEKHENPLPDRTDL